MKMTKQLFDGVLTIQTNSFSEVTLTFIKNQNAADGYGISRTVHIDLFTEMLEQEFVQEARVLL